MLKVLVQDSYCVCVIQYQPGIFTCKLEIMIADHLIFKQNSFLFIDDAVIENSYLLIAEVVFKVTTVQERAIPIQMLGKLDLVLVNTGDTDHNRAFVNKGQQMQTLFITLLLFQRK
ncbi:UNKNOWN [Stylonychia lemnae]|uniref:Uncharacterized protein n=1 Tax=Stylonychia lemnae TaxID=5949 RepID=A0A078B946_STYLE|nr:UNKNOWN [Stylonychia lemnae]|eukprot:CDW90761.1 UNKNOWN [Stylonychia lemnae]